MGGKENKGEVLMSAEVDIETNQRPSQEAPNTALSGGVRQQLWQAEVLREMAELLSNIWPGMLCYAEAKVAIGSEGTSS